MAILHSFPKDTACGPSGLRIQHLIEAAEVALQFPIGAVLRDVVNLLISGKVPVQVARFLTGGNLVALGLKNNASCSDYICGRYLFATLHVLPPDMTRIYIDLLWATRDIRLAKSV